MAGIARGIAPPKPERAGNRSTKAGGKGADSIADAVRDADVVAMMVPDSPDVPVVGELYDVPLDTLRERFIPAEPEELELSIIQLADGSCAVAVVLRRDYLDSPGLTDISELADWRAYRAVATQIR